MAAALLADWSGYPDYYCYAQLGNYSLWFDGRVARDPSRAGRLVMTSAPVHGGPFDGDAVNVDAMPVQQRFDHWAQGVLTEPVEEGWGTLVGRRYSHPVPRSRPRGIVAGMSYSHCNPLS